MCGTWPCETSEEDLSTATPTSADTIAAGAFTHSTVPMLIAGTDLVIQVANPAAVAWCAQRGIVGSGAGSPVGADITHIVGASAPASLGSGPSHVIERDGSILELTISRVPGEGQRGSGSCSGPGRFAG